MDAYIVSTVRTPVARAFRGGFRATRPDDLAALVLTEVLRRAAFPAAEIEDVILGCAMPEAEQGMNVARIAALRAQLPVEVSAMTVNRFCASGLEAIAIASERAQAGAQAVLAGGTESMSLIPMGGHKISANPWLTEHHPDSYLSMGLTAERLAAKYGITRQAADEFSLRSHQRAVAAQEAGKFREELLPVATRVPAEGNGRGFWSEVTVAADEGPRRDTSLAALAALKPAFQANGQVTAGNSSQMSDGAAAALVVGEEALRRHQLQPLARLAGYATAGVEPGLMGLGPVAAIPRALARAGVKLADIEVIELNEAFAAQALVVIAQAGLDPERVNVNGGAVAMGHPLGCTGAKLVASILAELRRRRARFGLVTMCVGGGMGAAGVLENLAR